MFMMHYEFVKSKLPDSIMMYTDTDSLIYYNPTSSLEDFIVKLKDKLDLSNLPDISKNLGLDPNKNKMVPGYFKIESAGDDSKFERIKEFYANAPKMYEVISESDKCKMRTKGFKDGLISRGEIRVEVGEKKFYTIKSEKHDLILKEMRRTINPENNNKRQFIGKHISVPYGFRESSNDRSSTLFKEHRPLVLIEDHKKQEYEKNEDNIRNIIESFSGKEILSYSNDNPITYHVSCDSKDPPITDLLIAKLLGDSN
jgi:hypothetical protein